MSSANLLEIPLIRRALDSRNIYIARPIDARWNYSNIIPTALAGFNPLQMKVYLPQISYLADALFNEQPQLDEEHRPQWLQYETLYAVHDFIHTRVMIEAVNFFGAAFFCLDNENSLGATAYCLALSEVAATIGLDYWHFCQDPDRYNSVTSTRITGLTTSYVKDDKLRAIDRLVNKKSFFDRVFSLYGPVDYREQRARANERLGRRYEWFQREIRQASKFTNLMNAWLGLVEWGYAAPDGYWPTEALVNFKEHIAEWTWEIFVRDDLDRLATYAPVIDNPFREYSFSRKAIDPRFANLLADANEPLRNDPRFLSNLSERQFRFAASQIITSLRFDGDLLTAFEFTRIVKERDVNALLRIVERASPVGSLVKEPSVLVFPN
ncbi:hypothetical protein [Rhizobium leguminosarum]|uniref:hypothetical protein n=1 Tax=Rhizobium leguminosarum TaxID=384 RepID=UPI0013DA03F2|nr:hypothetical protein [Rhizobium leguminosarum]NEI02412.1 hypothetical protein [Rhizobium leguminosarum]